MITLSIVSHQQAALIAKLLDDIAQIDSPRITSIILTHNVPESAPAWPASLVDRIVTIDNRSPRGFGMNHNAAFLLCKTPYFTVMNPDLHIPADPFDALLAAFESTQDGDAAPRGIGMVAPRIVTAKGHPEDSARSLMTPISIIRRRFSRSHRKPAVLPHWLAGMFLMVSSQAFRKVGGFDERFFMYCEDFDLCARFRLAGWDFKVADTATVIHSAQRASHRSRRHLGWHLSSLLKMWTSATFWRYRRLLNAEMTIEPS